MPKKKAAKRSNPVAAACTRFRPVGTGRHADKRHGRGDRGALNRRATQGVWE